MDFDHAPRARRHLLAVYRDHETVEAARASLIAADVPASAITIDESSDTDASLRAEMREELTKSWILPQASFVATKEGARGFVVLAMSLGAVGLVLGVPLAFIDFGLNFWARLLIIEAVILTMTFTIALVLGPGLASSRPQQAMAAERGITLRVAADEERVQQILIDHDPIRLDQVTVDDDPVEVVATEEDLHTSSNVAAEAGKGIADVAANTATDDYHAPPGRTSTDEASAAAPAMPDPGAAPMTDPQDNYLHTLAQQAGEVPPEGPLSDDQAAAEIRRLQAITGRDD